MKKIHQLALAVAAVALSGTIFSADAGFVGMPKMLGGAVHRIAFRTPVLPPMAFTQFCMRYVEQCKSERIVFRGGATRLNAERWEDLKDVNRLVNASISPETNINGLAGEKWVIGPETGDCNDYAVTKRAQLIARGWPGRALLLSEVVTSWGEHHLVLVVRTSQGDLVLDNMTSQIRLWTQAPYRWVRMQTPTDPNLWASLSARKA